MTLDQLEEIVKNNVVQLFDSLRSVQDNFPKQEWPSQFKRVGEEMGFPCTDILEIISK